MSSNKRQGSFHQQNNQNSSNINKNPNMSNYNNQNNPNKSEFQNPNQSQQSQKKPNPPLNHYLIMETRDKVYIKHQKSCRVVAIDRSFEKFYEVKDYDEVLNMKMVTTIQADSILGILDINKSNKYLIIVTSSKIAAKFRGSYIYNIHNVRLVKITFFKEAEDEEKCKKEITGLFATRNFYYSNDYDLSLSLNMQEKNISDNEYLINLSLLIPFYNNKIAKMFYSHLIFGYVGCKIDVDLKDLENGNNKSVDIIVIERYYKKSLLVNDDIQRHLKQIELITVYKEGEKEQNCFSLVIYSCNELFYQNVKGVLNPYNDYVKKELNKFNEIICVINDIYILQNNNSLFDFIHSNDELKSTVKLTNLTKQWKPNKYFESNENCDKYITSYLCNSKLNQEKVIWFIDINNNMINPKYCNDICFKAIVRIFWIAIQKQMITMGWNANIGLFHTQNERNISVKFKDIVMPYYNDAAIKRYLYNPKIRNLIQVVYDFCFNGKFYNSKNMIFDNKNNIVMIDRSNTNYRDMQNSAINKTDLKFNYNKLSVLCITWNVSNLFILDDNIDISNLFKENILYKNECLPDIIFIGLQEIIELTGPVEELCNQDTTEKVLKWTEKLNKYIRSLYPNVTYVQVKILHMVGIYFICFMKIEHQQKVNLVDYNIVKTGFGGQYGNKGYIIMTLKCFDTYVSVACVHFEAGEENNKTRFENLKQLLNNNIKLEEDRNIIFKDVDYWIILGDTNFRVEMGYKDALLNIQNNNLNVILKDDQFYKYKNSENEFNIINEGIINFNPTYKFIKGENKYEYDEKKIRIPSWTDRIFYPKKNGIKNIMYNSISNLFQSDHKPVIAVFDIFYKNS